MAKVRDLLDTIGNVILAGYDWQSMKAARSPRAFLNAVAGTVNYLRDPATPGNQVAEGEPALGDRFRAAASKLARFYALCSSHKEMRHHRDEIAFFEEIRVWMAKADAETRNPHLAIEALRRLVEQEMRKVTRHNVVRQQSFSDRLAALMTRYTNQNLSSAQVIAELIAMAREVSADASRGQGFAPPLTGDELAFYDAVAQNESAVTEMGTGVLADIARDLVRSLRRDVTTDWVSRDDVRAKLRSTIKRLLARHGYPPDAQPTATELVLRQMETFAEEWSPGAEWYSHEPD